MLAQAEAEL